MRANAALATRIDEAFDHPETDHEVIVKEVDAGMNGGLIQEQEAPVVQDVRASGAGKAELQKPALNSSPFSEDGSVRADDSWLKMGMRTSKTTKDKKTARPNNEGHLFGRRIDYGSIDQSDQLN